MCLFSKIVHANNTTITNTYLYYNIELTVRNYIERLTGIY